MIRIYRNINMYLDTSPFKFSQEHNCVIAPKMVAVDYELAQSSAVDEVFGHEPDFKRINCYFHYRQALHKKAKKLGLWTRTIKKNTYYIYRKIHRSTHKRIRMFFGLHQF